jgi:hypothetical protein
MAGVIGAHAGPAVWLVFIRLCRGEGRHACKFRTATYEGGSDRSYHAGPAEEVAAGGCLVSLITLAVILVDLPVWHP